MSTRYPLSVLLALAAVTGCQTPTPPPASVTVQEVASGDRPEARRIDIDGLVESWEWNRADTVRVALADGRDVAVLRQRGPDSIDFAFLGLGGNYSRQIVPEVLIDVSREAPLQFGRDTWWFRMSPIVCVKRGGIDLGCLGETPGFEVSSFPRARTDNLEVRIPFALMEYSPARVPEVGLAVRFSERPLFVEAIWPEGGELRRPDTWGRVDLSR